MKLNEQQVLHLAAQAKETPHKHGFLYKKSGKKNTSPDHTAVRWQKRWCIIYYNMLFYFENEKIVKPRGVIFLEGAKCQALAVPDKTLFCFVLALPSEEQRQFLFACDLVDERDAWVRQICATTGGVLINENAMIKSRIHELEQYVEVLKDEKEKLRHELSDHWSQVTRLKLELSNIRGRGTGISTHSVCESIRTDTGYSSGSNATSSPECHYTPEEIQKLVKLQAFIRSWLVRRNWKGLIKEYMDNFKYDKLIERNRFVTSEEDYVLQMSVLANTFLVPMKKLSYTGQDWLTKEAVAKIFSTSESILVLHQVFIKGMETRMKSWPAVQIDDLLIAVVTVVPIYIEYVKNLPTALKTLGECKKRVEFVRLLKWFEAKPDCHGQTLEQFLHYPVRVIPNYIRNIHDILEVTPENHAERKALGTILETLHQAQTYNHSLDESENIRHTLEIERLIEGGCEVLLNADQQFIRHGVLKQLNLDSKRSSFSKREKVRHCFLFSHHLIIASRTVDGRLRLSKHNGTVPLAQVSLNEEIVKGSYPEHMKCRAFSLSVNTSLGSSSSSIIVMLMAAKSTEKALWTSDISQCVYNLALEEDEEAVNEDQQREQSESKTEHSPKQEEGKDVVVVVDKVTENVAYSIPLNREAGDLVTPIKCRETGHYFTAVNPEERSIRDDTSLRENSHDINYGDELVGPYHLPQIVNASVDRLIHRLSDPRLPGADFMETFLLTYRSFTTSKAVMEGLMQSYWNVMGGPPSPPKAESPDRKKLAVSRTSSTRSRVRSILSTSSFSSIDDLDASFNSTAAPFTSTTVFNYNTLKEQLNSPTRRSADTTKWCEDSVTTNKENQLHPRHRRRSLSACNILMDTSNYPATDSRLTRSQSVEVIVDKLQKKEDGGTNKRFNSCEDLNEKVGISRIISVSQSSNLDIKDATSTSSNLTLENDYNDEQKDKMSNEPELLISDAIPVPTERSSENADSNPLNEANGIVSCSIKITNEQGSDKLSRCSSVGSCRDLDQASILSGSSVEIDRNSIDRSSVGTNQNSIDIDRNSIEIDRSSIEFDRTSEIDTASSSYDRSSILGSSLISETSSMTSVPDSPLHTRISMLPQSYSDEGICKQRSSSDLLSPPIKSQSLDQKKAFTSPYFHRKKKEKTKKEKPSKKRSSSEPSSDVPVLLNMTNRRTGQIFNRSQSQYGASKDDSNDIEYTALSLDRKKNLTPSSSLPIPVPSPEITVKKPTPEGTPKRKRSIFTGKVPFLKGGLKRASSELVLNISESTRRNLNSNNLSNSTLSLEGKGRSSTLVDDMNKSKHKGGESALVNDKTDDLNASIKGHRAFGLMNMSLKGDRTFGRKKKTQQSVKHLNIFDTVKESTQPTRRKTSVFEQGRPPIAMKKSVSVNRGPLKIMSIFKHWLAKHPKDFIEDPEMLALLQSFFHDIKKDERTLPVVKEIVASLEKSLLAHRKSLAAVHPFDELLLQQHSLRTLQETTDINGNPDVMEMKSLHSYSYHVVAENMTLLEHYLYAKISFNEFISCQWTKKDKEEKAPGIMKFIKRFNQVTKLISYNVVHGETPAIRASMLEFWIRVAAHCRDLNNFNAIMEIISALNASAVHRLKKSWDLVVKPMKEVFTDLELLVRADRSFKNLREAVHVCNPPCVPYLGSYLSDLLFVHDGGQTFKDNGLVNYAKMCRISRLVREVKCYQQLPYTLKLNREVAYALVNFDKVVDEDMLYDHSLLAEPRAS